MDSGSVASSSAYASGYAAFQAGEKQVEKGADTIASASSLNSGTESASEQKIPSADQVNQALLDLKQGSIYAQAGAKVMQTDFDTTGSLLSVIA
ncbi:MAG: hypothetical protein LM514_01995 [Streptococcus sp.]|jgi:cell division protein YceG involved in septum cleavage|nr:hypothetical protein [Streptococcus sp.]NJM11309.1 hypothetical protein [Synechococcaceae cyanobacterium SM1_2_3]